MRWSLSEFLGLLEIRGQCWCLVDLASDGGFSIRHSDTLYCYAVVDGRVRIAGLGDAPLTLSAGDMLMIPAGDAHAVRFHDDNRADDFPFLNTDSYADIPPRYRIGGDSLGARLLCGRLKVRWPFGQKPRDMPAVLRIPAEQSLIDAADFYRLSAKAGSPALLTRAASLLFMAAFRDSPECAELFKDSFRHNPIARCREIIDKHPFKEWTVAKLARKVGMGRSSFAAQFVAETGKTPIEYVTEARMRHAAQLLEHTELKIAAISEHIGYKSESAFSRRFSDFYGMSPGKMRQQLREGDKSVKP